MKSEETHPWINFKLNLSGSDLKLWLHLGEAASKCAHLAGVPLRPDYAAELHQIYLAKGALATTAIEGNTLNEQQALALVEGKLKLPPSQEYLQQEIQNIVDLCNEEASRQMSRGTSQGDELCVELIRHFNRGVLHNLEDQLEESVHPGEIRHHSVLVGNVYRGAPAEDCEQLLKTMCSWLNGSDFDAPGDDLKIPFAIIKAVVAHVYLAWIHPFGDGNGRTARMTEFHLLFAAGIPLPAAHLLSDHYNQTRNAYYVQLARASQSGGDLIPFIHYALQGFLDGLRSQIDRIQVQQLRVAWENYVHQQFRLKKTSPAQKRRRDLVLELTNRGRVPITQIELLTPELARAYAQAGDRMLSRDLNALSQMRLIGKTRKSVWACESQMKAFLAGRVAPDSDPDSLV